MQSGLVRKRASEDMGVREAGEEGRGERDREKEKVAAFEEGEKAYGAEEEEGGV